MKTFTFGFTRDVTIRRGMHATVIAKTTILQDVSEAAALDLKQAAGRDLINLSLSDLCKVWGHYVQPCRLGAFTVTECPYPLPCDQCNGCGRLVF